MNTVTIALSILLGLLFVVTGGVKVLNVAQSLNIRDHFGLPPRLWHVIGILETAGGAGLLIGLAVPILGTAASIGLAGLMIGAIISRLKVRDPATMISLDLGVLVLVAALIPLHALA
jgi:uncharacterized membrane protein YphA (DoxX/SURF4 family)